MSSFGIIALTPVSFTSNLEVQFEGRESTGSEQVNSHYAFAFAAKRSGETGVINLELHDLSNEVVRAQVTNALSQLAQESGGGYGIKYGAGQNIDATVILKSVIQSAHGATNAADITVIISSPVAEVSVTEVETAMKGAKALGCTVLLEATSRKEAIALAKLSPDGLVAKGSEAGGITAETTAYILLQETVTAVDVPVWVQGGIGLYSAAACYAAGARGVVIDSQLLLTRESALPVELKQRLASMDGTEITTISIDTNKKFRSFARQGHPIFDLDSKVAKVDSLVDIATYLPAPGKEISAKREDVLLVLGQDVALAKNLSEKFVSVAGVIEGLKDSAIKLAALAGAQQALKPKSGLAESHKTEYPIVQGAMTRVSDTAEFALSVAEGGGLPFLALSLMRGEESDILVSKTKELLKDKQWGVGILGFVPAELRNEQMAVINKYKPPFALIAGGRPDQAKTLEDTGIATYLHVPSPLLLQSFIEMGARRFIFEGRECGGHVGPRSSFVLWEQMIDILTNVTLNKTDASKFHILMAGGIHDGMSAAMVAAMTAPLTERGMKVGVLVGTAYLFTKEAVEAGAIVDKFQEAALACSETVLLETGPGHAIRCIDSPYKRTFDDKRVELTLAAKSKDEVREELELMNLGRLRIASKGVSRPNEKTATRESTMKELAESGTNDGGEKNRKLVEISEEEQWANGMYMIGQVASMHDKILTIKELHQSISEGSVEVLEKLPEVAHLTKNQQITAAAANASQRAKPRRDGWDNIAIVGMSCMFPKASDINEYWHNILAKVDAIEEVPIEQWDWRNYYDQDPLARDKIISKWGGFLRPMTFDPTKYGIPPSSLTSIDPMQLMLLEVTQRALEDAGYSNRSFGRKKTSVILANAGHGPVTALMSLRSMLGWKLAHLDDNAKEQIAEILPEWTEDSFAGYLGNVAAGRVANRFDLGGVNFSIDAACASSLAALYSSVQELRSGASDVVFLAAADTHNQPGDYLSFSKTHAFSKTGRCRTFDATADGIVISEGMAMMILKRVEDAERDGDRIYAVIKGVGGSSDGRDLSLTAPRPQGQMLALERAYEDAGFSPSTVELVEAHGTGTVAGDRAEIEALKQVFDQSGAERQNCAVGSVKTMIGHTKAAAGLASLIKVTKALHHKVLPPTLGVTVPNPSCDFENSPFYVNSESRPWVHSPKDGEHHRRAGVSAFGFGGTNFHCVLEEYKPVYSQKEEPSEKHWPSELFTISANSRGEMIKAVQQLGELSKRGAVDATPQSFTRFAQKECLKTADKPGAKAAKAEANGAGSAGECRLTIVAESFDDLIEKLKRAQSDLLSPQKSEIKDPRGVYFKEKQENESTAPKKIAFLFPGQGSQQTNMLADLAIAFPTIRKTFERADAALAQTLPKKLSAYIFPPPSFTKEDQEKRQTELTDTRIAQPAIGAANMAAFSLLSQFGISPDFTAGHSYGEYVALCASGVLSFADLIRISELRGRLLTGKESNQGGSMAAVTADREQVEQLLSAMRGVTLANINAPNQIVISGATDAVTDAVSALKKEKIAARTIPVSQAFHSEHMLHAKEPLKKALQAMTITAPAIPTYSNTDSQRYTDNAEEIAERLANHIVKPVDFVSQIRRMQADGAYYFVEVGPGAVLTNLTSAILQDTPHLAVSIDRSGRNGITQLLHALAQLWAHGVEFDLRALFDGRVELVQVADQNANQASAKPRLLFKIDSANINKVGAVAQTSDKQKQVSSSQSLANTTGGAQASTHSLAKNTTPASITIGTNPAAKESATRMTATTTNQTLKAPAAIPQNGGSNGASTNGKPYIGNAPGIVVQPNGGNGYAGNGNGNGQAGNGYATNGASTNGHQPVMNPQFNSPPNPQGQRPANNGNVDQVMVQFQQTMLEMTNSFLKTQQQVMTAYLMAKSGTPMPMPQIGWQPPQVQQPHPQQAPMMFNPSGQYPVQGMPFSPEQMGFAQVYPQQQVLPNSYQAAPAAYVQQLPQEQYVQQPAIEQTAQPTVALASVETNGSAPVEVVAEAPAVEEEEEETISSEKLVESLLDIVSQRTGYPPEMLDPELDLEADLGIDSIKRVEILNSFRKLLPEAKQRELEGGLEQLAGTKTLKGIIDWISADSSGSLGAESAPSTTLTMETSKAVSELLSENGNGNGHTNGNGNGNGNGKSHDNHLPQAVAALTNRKESASGHNIKRAFVEVTELAAPQAQPTKLPAGSISLIVAGDNGTYEDLGRALAARGERVMLVKHVVGGKDNVKLNNGVYELDTTSPEAVDAVIDTIRKTYGKIGRLINLLPLSKNVGLHTGLPTSVASLLNFSKSAYADLNFETHAGVATVTTATKCGGTFGSTHGEQGSIIGKERTADASVGGFMKCLAKEWSGVRCKAIDFEENAQPAQIASVILTELDAKEEFESNEDAAQVQKRVEIGYHGKTRYGLNVRLADVSESGNSNIELDSSSVILITGGARGITAEIALELSERFQPTLVLLGRTAQPPQEASHTLGINSMRDLKAAIMEDLKQSGQKVSISLVEAQYQKLLRDREIRDNLKDMIALGAKVEYIATDVRDTNALNAVVEKVIQKYGKIDGVIHGAGVIEDAYVKEKSIESFERVFTTKINSAMTLSKLAAGPDLKFFFLFSSVVGRTGNAGQCDYVSANEVLNKLAVSLNKTSKARVASLMWGPWNAGMAQPELESLFAKYGWAMIAPGAGRKAFMDDLLHGNKEEAELVIVAQLPQLTGVSTDKTVRLHDAFTREVEAGVYEFESTLNPEIDLYLKDHTFDSVPVMPMAMALEMMAEAAASLCPDKQLVNVNRLDIPAGIVFESKTKVISVVASKTQETGEASVVEATVLTGNKRSHFKASFELKSKIAKNGNGAGHRTDGLVAIPSFVPTKTTIDELCKDIKSTSPLPTQQSIYSEYMFHGPLFQGVTSVKALGEDGIVGELLASDPQKCISRDTKGNDWTIDPILLDSAMQLAGVWARQYLDITVLPTGFKRLHLGDISQLTQDKYFAKVFITAGTTARELTCDVAIYTESGELAMVIEGLGGIGSKSLNRLANQTTTTRS